LSSDSANQAIFSSADDGTATSYFTAYINSSDKLCVGYRNAGGAEDSYGTASFSFDGNWHLVTFETDGSSFKFSIDGSYSAVAGGPDNGNWWGDITATRDNITIGALKRSTLGSYFTGSIDEVAIFSDTLTTEQLAYIYNSGTPRDISVLVNIEDYWRFEEGTGSTTDNEDTDITFTLTGDPAWTSSTLGWAAGTGSADYSIAMGKSATVYELHSIGIGYMSNILSSNSIGIGYAADCNSSGGIAIGPSSKSSGTDALALGGSTVASGEYSTALGYDAEATNDHSIVLGTVDDSVGL